MYHEHDVAPIASYKFQFIAEDGTELFPETQRFIRMINDAYGNATDPEIAHLAEVAEILLEAQDDIMEIAYVMKYKSDLCITHTFMTYDGRKGYLSAARKS
jgi:hypothetical protein